MSENNSISSEQNSPNSTVYSTFYSLNNIDDDKLDKQIKNYINQDLDNLFPETVNSNPLNYSIPNIQQNNQTHLVTLRLFPTNQIESSSNNIIPNNNSQSSLIIPLKGPNPNLNQIPNQYYFKNYLSDDFNPDLWKNFYPINDPFFNYDCGNSLEEMKIKRRNKENPEIIETYEGQVNENKERHGLGKLTLDNKILMGHWRNDDFTGWGREINNNGDIYEGKFVEGLLYGKGIYTNGKEFYLGDFRNKRMIGFGEIFTDEYHYCGQLWDKMPHGKGRINIYNEGEYEGNFEYGDMDGEGIFKWNNGNYYVGEMKKGKLHGLGKLVHRNGFIEDGYFRDGNFVKKLDD